MEAFLVSTGVVALAEIGDKTQLLALVLAARFRKPVPIILGILVATLANHALAGAAGAWIEQYFDTARPEVHDMLAEIAALAALNIDPALPRVGEAASLLQSVIRASAPPPSAPLAKSPRPGWPWPTPMAPAAPSATSR
jgi:putative Ca2+/H+ antiporter (TMEM165/GDT1 family)